MIPQNEVRTVHVQDVTFFPPAEDAYRLIRRKHIGSSLPGIIFSGAAAAAGIGAVFHSDQVIFTVFAVLLCALFIYLMIRMLRPLHYGVRFGTVIDDYSRESGSGDDTTTYYYVTLRLDDTGELIHNLYIVPHLSTVKLTGKQVMLCKQPKHYHLYDAANLEHPVWNPVHTAEPSGYPEAYADRSSMPQTEAGLPAASPAREVTIQDITFYDLPTDLYENIRKANSSMNGIMLLILIAMLVPFLGVFVMALGREMVEYWYITLPVAAVIAVLIIITIRNDKKREAHPDLKGVRVHVLSCKTNTAPIRITFTVPETGQTVVDQRIEYNYCGGQFVGMIAVLVRNNNNTYFLFPPDYRHR